MFIFLNDTYQHLLLNQVKIPASSQFNRSGRLNYHFQKAVAILCAHSPSSIHHPNFCIHMSDNDFGLKYNDQIKGCTSQFYLCHVTLSICQRFAELDGLRQLPAIQPAPQRHLNIKTLWFLCLVFSPSIGKEIYDYIGIKGDRRGETR